MNMQVHTNVSMHVHVGTCMYICIHGYVPTYVRVFICTHVVCDTNKNIKCMRTYYHLRI